MEYPKYKEISQKLDDIRERNNKRKLNVIVKLFIYLATIMILSMLKAMVSSIREKKAFDRKYKTVIKENCFGFRSYEYHERDYFNN